MPGCRLLATAVTLGSLKIQPREPTSMPDMRDAIGGLLAGGQGERLWPLTRDRAQPPRAVPGVAGLLAPPAPNFIQSRFVPVFGVSPNQAIDLNLYIRAGRPPLVGPVGYIAVL